MSYTTSRPYKSQSRLAQKKAYRIFSVVPAEVPIGGKLGFFEGVLFKTPAGGEVTGRAGTEGVRRLLQYLDSIPQLNTLGKAINDAAEASRKSWGEEDIDRALRFIPAQVYSQLTGKSIQQIEAARKAMADAEARAAPGMQTQCTNVCKSRYPGKIMSPRWANNTCYCNIQYTASATMQSKCVSVCKSKYPGRVMNPLWSNNSCYCRLGSTSTGGTTGSRFPAKSGTSGNCSWDTKGGWCWKGIACGGNCTICRTGYATTNTSTGCNAVRSYFLDNYRRCTSCGSGSGTGCSTDLKQRCGNICAQKGGTPYLDSKCSCFCRSTTSSKPCPYSGCSSSKEGSLGCYRCRCTAICKKGGYPGVKSVSSNGSCYCNPKSSASGSVSKLTSGCSYSGCNSFTGMSRCNCRCSKICASKGGVKTVTSSGGCYCKGVSSSTSGGCSTYLKQRCGNICAQKPGDPYLDSKCSCFCR